MESIELNGGIQDVFSIGNTPSICLDLALRNTSDTIYSTTPINVEIGLKINNKIEYIPLGIFNIATLKKDDFTIKITAYDNMSKFKMKHSSALGDSATLTQVVNEIAAQTGVKFEGSLPAYNVKKLEGFSCREVLGYIASLCGGNAIIKRDGKFTIVYPTDINRDIGEGVFDFTREEVKYKIGKITCQVSDSETLSKGSLGTDSMELQFENPWMNATILTDIYNKLNGFEYLGYKIKWQGDPSLDIGDIITYTDDKGVIRKLPIFNRKLSYDGGLDSELSAKGETKNENSSDSSGLMSKKVNRVVTELAIVNEAIIGKANIKDVEAVSIRTQTLEAKTAKIEEAIIDVAHIKDLNAINANIQNLIAADATINNALINKADITELNAVKGTINSLDSKIANIETLVNGNLSSENIQAGGITSDKLTISNGFITNAMISSLDVAKINAGNISTNKFRIVSDSGKMLIADNTIQIRDNNRVRVQIGKDASNDYSMYVWDSTGKLMFDATGLKADGIKDSIIRDDMISDDANIDGSKIDINSLVTEINKGTNTTVIKSTKIQIDSLKQTLDVAFNSLKSQADGTKNLTESNSTTIGVMQGQISTAINNTQIVKDGKTTLLKDDYNKTVAKVDSINSTIGTHTTKIDQLTGNITSVDTKVNSVQRDLEGTKSTVSSHTTQINGLNSTVSTQGSSINQLKDKIALKVEASDITNAVNNIQIGGRNLLKPLARKGSPNTTVINKGIKIDLSTSRDSYFYIDLYDSVTLGENLTLSFDVSGLDGTLDMGIISQNKNTVKLKNGRVYKTFKVDSELVSDNYKGKTLLIDDFARQTTSNDIRLTNFKLERGTRATDWTPAPEDIDLAITSVDNKVTSTNNKVATIETNLSSITSRVSTTENNIKTINGNVSSLQSRMSSAEQKITSNAIISTVTSSSNWSSLNNTLNNKLDTSTANNTFATKSSLTQTETSIVAKFEASGGYNLLKDSGFLTSSLDKWSLHTANNPTGGIVTFLAYTQDWAFPDRSVHTCQMQLSNQSNVEYGIKQKFNTIPGKKYTVSFYTAAHRLTQGRIIIRSLVGGSWVDNKTFKPHLLTGGNTDISNWQFVTFTFTATETAHIINICINTALNDGYMWIAKPQINEGEIALPYSINPSEIYEGSTQIDANGVTILNGAIRVKNNAGETVLSGDSNGNLLYTGALYSQVDSTHYAKLEPILTNSNKDVKLRLSLVGSTEHSNFDIVNASGTRLFKVGHGGVEIHKYLTLDTDQTGTYATRCYWENGTYRPEKAEKALVGTNTYYFNTVYSRYLGRDRISGSYTTVQAGAVNVRTAYGGEGCYFDSEGYFRPAVSGAWANGHPNYRWSTVYSVYGVNTSSDLRLKENVEYVQESNNSLLSTDNNKVTQQDMYDFIKDEFKLASYNYKGEKFTNDKMSYNLGFIAQDLKDSNVGQQFIIPPQDEADTYSYNMASYIGVLAGALRIAINKIESLENRIKILESKGA